MKVSCKYAAGDHHTSCPVSFKAKFITSAVNEPGVGGWYTVEENEMFITHERRQECDHRSLKILEQE